MIIMRLVLDSNHADLMAPYASCTTLRNERSWSVVELGAGAVAWAM